MQVEHYQIGEKLFLLLKKALAIVFTLEQFRLNLLGVHILLLTDHSAVRGLHSIEPKGRIAS